MLDCWSSFASSKPGMVLRDGLHLDAELPQLVEIGAEDLDRDRRGDAAEHVADAIGERPADHGEDAGHAADALA